jgi:hypothetical protein
MTKNLNLNWQTQGVTPTLVSGDDALMVYNSLPEKTRVGLRYDETSKTMIGSTSIAVANLDAFAQKYGARTPNLRDLSRPEVMRIAKGKHYIDSRNLVVRSIEDPSWSQNNSLLRTIYELAEQKEGSIKYPFMIEGFSFVPNPKDKNGYGLTFVAGSDFRVVQDERFDGKHNGESFSEVDELGIPNFDKKGSRTWYAKNKGLSRLCLNRDLDLLSIDDDLTNSGDIGRVVFLK